MTKVTAEYIRSVLDYNPDTGDFHWKPRKDISKTWNSRFANKIAGTIMNTRYRNIRIDGKSTYLAHRLAFLIMTGELPACEVDHRDEDRGNNRWSNLRLANKSQNKINCGLTKANTSGWKGVSRVQDKWHAVISVNGDHYDLGLYDRPEDAAEAYRLAALDLHGEFVHETVRNLRLSKSRATKRNGPDGHTF